MIIARVPTFTFEVPEPPVEMKTTDIEAKTYSGPLSADDYVFTRCALPHQDEVFHDKYFVTLSLVDGFELGDVKARNLDKHSFVNINSFRLSAGDLFIVDPRTTHWLVPNNCDDLSSESPMWVGIQWVIERRKLTESVKKIVAELAAVSVGCEDRRYARMLAKVFP